MVRRSPRRFRRRAPALLNQVSILLVTSLSLAMVLAFGSAVGRRVISHLAPTSNVAAAGRPVRAAHVRAAPPAGFNAAPGGPTNIYAATTATSVPARLAGIPERVYVPDSTSSGMVDVIDPSTLAVVGHFAVGHIPYHITPSWDMTRLYVANEASSSLTVVDPLSGQVVTTIPVAHPYNLYFTPDGATAIGVDERERKLLLMDPHTFAVSDTIPIPWAGVDHMDFSADGSYLLATTEFAGVVVKVDLVTHQVAGFLHLGGQPIDVRLAPNGTEFYVANQTRGGVSIVDPVAMKETGFIATGRGAHGFQLSRDTAQLYVSNRLGGTVSVISLATNTVVATWRTGGNPDMMQISPDGRQLWVSGRYNRDVYVVDTATGALLATIGVGLQPHGLVYFPNVGRYSLGHNGMYR
jgi:YVTN family beta-propeller protein